MAEESAAPVTADATKPVEDVTRSAELVAEPAVAEAKSAEEGVVATEGVAEVPKDTNEEPESKNGDVADAQPTSEAAPGDADAPAANGTPAAKKANNAKRASDKKKTPAKGKKKAPELRLNVSAGEMYMVAMRGYQPWPVIVCDEEMLPESLLSKRPVSARRIDGTYREDFLEGGKNAKDRRYPIMFLGTNEFAWQVNTELLPFDLEEVKQEVESGKQGKKNKALWEAYQTAAEGHDLAHFKTMLASHEEAMQQDAEQREQKEQEKAEKAAKAAKRKSTAAADSDDVEMEDAGDDSAPKKAKASKKRKKGEESDGENEKAAKTPKTKLKLTTKTPKDASAAKPKKEPKSKKKSSEEAEPVPVEEPPMTEEERLQKREKQILYLRHRLQKGFLSRDQAPKDEDMLNMSDYLKQLEAHEDLEAEIIKKTKVHKVLKNIIKLNDIPKEEEYRFKDRSGELLSKWGTALAAESEPPTATSATGEPTTNGVKHEDGTKSAEPAEPANADAPAEPAPEKKEDAPSEPAITDKHTDADGDVAMNGADKDTKADAPAAPAPETGKAPEVAADSEKVAPATDAITA